VEHRLDAVGEYLGGAVAQRAPDERGTGGTASANPVDRSSSTVTSCPAATSCPATTLPM
jgi:hypothetical protein